MLALQRFTSEQLQHFPIISNLLVDDTNEALRTFHTLLIREVQLAL